MLSNLASFLLIIVPLAVVLLSGFLLAELKVRETELFEDLGRPHVWFPNASGIGFIFEFLLMGEFRSRIASQGLGKLAATIQVLTIVWMTLFVGILLYAGAAVL